MDNLRKGNLGSPEAQKYIIYNDGELAFCENVHGLVRSDFPVQLEVYVVALVLEGKAVLNVGDATIEAQKNDLFICTPNSIVEKGLLSLDFKGYFIFTSTAYIQRIMPLSENSWDVKFFFQKSPLYHMTPQEAAVFSQYYDLLCSKARLSTPVQKKVIDTLMLAFIYDMSAALSHYLQKKPRPFTAGENLFKRFIELLEASYPRKRMISYYAERLNVTSKYLSSVCTKVGGVRPSVLVDRYVLKDIEYLMKHTQKSIKEIACELEFPNLSFFGKYVKQHMGVSPKVYRAQLVKTDDGLRTEE
ncbi:MAG: helix-turn-helix domain-containing protein [Bacteroidaceae bacterium]|jgi:AraC family transcriptional activator of pobA